MFTKGLRQRRLEDVGVSLLEVSEGEGDKDLRGQEGVAPLSHHQHLVITLIPQDLTHGAVEPYLVGRDRLHAEGKKGG